MSEQEGLSPALFDNAAELLGNTGSANHQSMMAALRALEILAPLLSVGVWDCKRAELSRALDRSPNAVSRVLRRLERAGILARQNRGRAGLRIALVARETQNSKPDNRKQPPATTKNRGSINRSDILLAVDHRVEERLRKGAKIRDPHAYRDRVFEALVNDPDAVRKILARRRRAAALRARQIATRASEDLDANEIERRRRRLEEAGLRPEPLCSDQEWLDAFSKGKGITNSAAKLSEYMSLCDLFARIRECEGLRSALPLSAVRAEELLDSGPPSTRARLAEAQEVHIAWSFLIADESRFSSFEAGEIDQTEEEVSSRAWVISALTNPRSRDAAI